MTENKKHSQHKILLPTWLTATHGNRCAFNILHLQGHVCVKFLCREHTNIVSHATVYMTLPDSGEKKVTTHLVVHRAWLSSLQINGEN